MATALPPRVPPHPQGLWLTLGLSLCLSFPRLRCAVLHRQQAVPAAISEGFQHPSEHGDGKRRVSSSTTQLAGSRVLSCCLGKPSAGTGSSSLGGTWARPVGKGSAKGSEADW